MGLDRSIVLLCCFFHIPEGSKSLCSLDEFLTWSFLILRRLFKLRKPKTSQHFVQSFKLFVGGTEKYWRLFLVFHPLSSEKAVRVTDNWLSVLLSVYPFVSLCSFGLVSFFFFVFVAVSWSVVVFAFSDFFVCLLLSGAHFCFLIQSAWVS